MPDLVSQLALGDRTVRRAVRELEQSGFVTCRRTSTHHKTVWDVTNRPAQTGPRRGIKPAQTGPKRPKPAQDPCLARSSSLNSNQPNADAATNGAREAQTAGKQQQQLLLGLSGCIDDEQRRLAGSVVGQLETAVRAVWDRLGKRHGFLLWDDSTVSGLAIAIQRYPVAELVDCVVWSAHELAQGRLKPGWFATSFRGNAFCDRHRVWQAHLERIKREKVERKRRAEEASRPPAPEPTGEGIACVQQWMESHR